jgi:hypothetical protein
LFLFKKKFGNVFKSVYIGKHIVNKEIYTKVCQLWESKNTLEVRTKYSKHLLKYRY